MRLADDRPIFLLNLNLHDRPHVRFPAIDGVIAHAENDHSPEDQTAVNHRLGRRRRYRWPEAEKEDDGQVDARKPIIDNAPHTRYASRAPDQRDAGGDSQRVRGLGRDLDAAGAATVKQQTAVDEIRGGQTGDGKRDDVGEGG